jgi:hypothetical protein
MPPGWYVHCSHCDSTMRSVPSSRLRTRVRVALACRALVGAWIGALVGVIACSQHSGSNCPTSSAGSISCIDAGGQCGDASTCGLRAFCYSQSLGIEGGLGTACAPADPCAPDDCACLLEMHCTCLPGKCTVTTTFAQLTCGGC